MFVYMGNEIMFEMRIVLENFKSNIGLYIINIYLMVLKIV